MDPNPKPAPSATFPLTHGSAPRTNDLTDPTALREQLRHHRSRSRRSIDEEPTSPDEGRHRPSHRQLFEHPVLDGAKSHRHKHSKSREIRLPRPMSHLASSASARGLLPTWSGRDKEREEDDGLLRPLTRETTRSRWGSESTSGLDSRSRKGSLLDNPEQNERLGPIQRQDIQSMEDLEQVKRRRKQGEEYLRSALSSIGTLATELTRRLDYTYYNLLEKITSLNSTIASFQDLSDSAASLLENFEQDINSLDQDLRKQIEDLKGFHPQIELADGLEKRMTVGRQRVEELGKRLETVRGEIDRWEQREQEWQSRISRRLRILWTISISALLVFLLGLVIQNWPSLPQSDEWPIEGNQSTFAPSLSSEANTGSWYPSSLAERRKSLMQVHPTGTPSGTHAPLATPTEDELLRILDEL